jgi:hypothetical protein
VSACSSGNAFTGIAAQLLRHHCEMPLFHASVLKLEPGAVVAPGAWGARIFATGVRHNLYFRELELERSRLRVDPSLPSRLSSAFAFHDQQAARAFAAQQAAQSASPHLVYEVGLIPGSASSSLPMDHINMWWSLTTPSEIESWADAYWGSEGHVGSDAETLAAGGLTVISFVDRVVPPGWRGRPPISRAAVQVATAKSSTDEQQRCSQRAVRGPATQRSPWPHGQGLLRCQAAIGATDSESGTTRIRL